MPKLPSMCVIAVAASYAFWLNSWPIQASPLQIANGSEISVGHVIACDTPQQVESFLGNYDGDVGARLVAVNAQFGKQSCEIVTIAFVKVTEAKVVLVSNGIVRIIEVKIVGMETPGGWTSVLKPLPKYIGVLESAMMV
jgi:hypothetical protein